MILKGRREIFTDEREITKKNICEVFCEAFDVHLFNASDIKYLQEYERGQGCFHQARNNPFP